MPDDKKHELKTLPFLTPTFHSSSNYTVRLGRKWWDSVRLGDCVKIAKTGEEHTMLHKAEISGRFMFKMKYLPNYVLDKEHDPNCRTREGMIAAMREAYPDVDDWDEQEVTVLRFEIKSDV